MFDFVIPKLIVQKEIQGWDLYDHNRSVVQRTSTVRVPRSRTCTTMFFFVFNLGVLGDEKTHK